MAGASAVPVARSKTTRVSVDDIPAKPYSPADAGAMTPTQRAPARITRATERRCRRQASWFHMVGLPLRVTLTESIA